MARQVAVKKMLVDGFGEENVEVYGPNDAGMYVVKTRHGGFIVDAEGNIKYPDGCPDELCYWIGVDLQSLDILREEEKFKALEKAVHEEEVAYHPETFYADGDW